jgi:hypothetical protein
MTRPVPVRRRLLAHLFQRPHRRPGARARHPAPVEALEDRTLMSTLQDFDAPAQLITVRTAGSTAGVFDPQSARWFLRNQNSSGPPTTAAFTYGAPGWTPVVGDWDRDGDSTIGVYAPDGTWFLRNTNSAGAPDLAPFVYGGPGFLPVVGDWNGDGVTTIGVFNPATAQWFLRNSNSAGPPDLAVFAYGPANSNWRPVVGDWNGDGVTTVGLFDPATAQWFLRNENFEGPLDASAVFSYGAPGWNPIVGDWDGDGVTTVGVFDPATAQWFLRNSNSAGPPGLAVFSYGGQNWAPAAGDWNEVAPPGRWSPVTPLPVVAIHTHLLPTGQVLFWDRVGSSYLWDPASGAIAPVTPSTPGYDTFCSGHSFLPDGRLLIVGGHNDATGHPHADGVGVPFVSVFNPFTNSWSRLPDMNAGRWYPTSTTLANGDVLVLSGTSAPGVLDTLPQVLMSDGTWRSLTNAQDAVPLGVDLYPRMFLTPDGRVFKAGPDQDTWFLNTSGLGAWTPGPRSLFGLRTYGSAVMYEPGKILIAGGGDPPTATAEVIDLNAPNPSWRSVAPMAFPRRQHNATLLPDGKVLVTGGSSGPGFSNEANPVLPAEVWDPATERWTTLAAEQVPRLYHSTALLLPDGRVLSAGGGEPGTNHPDGEVFSPPYLLQGPRPTISSAPATASYGQTFSLATPDAAGIAKVSLIRLASVTHAFDENQRYLSLGFTRTATGLNVAAPANPNLAPPGHYMLFLLNGNGVPSVARIIQLAPSTSLAGAATTEVDLAHSSTAPTDDGRNVASPQAEAALAAVDAALAQFQVPKKNRRGGASPRSASAHHEAMHRPSRNARPGRGHRTASTGASRSRPGPAPRPGP